MRKQILSFQLSEREEEYLRNPDKFVEKYGRDSTKTVKFRVKRRIKGLLEDLTYFIRKNPDFTYDNNMVTKFEKLFEAVFRSKMPKINEKTKENILKTYKRFLDQMPSFAIKEQYVKKD